MDSEGWKYLKSHTQGKIIVYSVIRGPDVNVMFNMSGHDVQFTQKQCNTKKRLLFYGHYLLM